MTAESTSGKLHLDDLPSASTIRCSSPFHLLHQQLSLCTSGRGMIWLNVSRAAIGTSTRATGSTAGCSSRSRRGVVSVARATRISTPARSRSCGPNASKTFRAGARGPLVHERLDSDDHHQGCSPSGDTEAVPASAAAQPVTGTSDVPVRRMLPDHADEAMPGPQRRWSPVWELPPSWQGAHDDSSDRVPDCGRTDSAMTTIKAAPPVETPAENPDVACYETSSSGLL
jgi:hypothetical protein